MLIEFSVRNYMSLKSEQTVTFVPTALTELPENVFDTGVQGADRLLKSVAIYGANAAGKTNVLAALMNMRTMVLRSARDGVEDEAVPVRPFAFDESADTPTMMQVVFLHEGIRYQYGFECTRERITEEWMYVYPERRSQLAFMRTYNAATGAYDWDFKSWLKGKKAQSRDATGPHSLFVSIAARNNEEQIVKVREWFRDQIVDEAEADQNKMAEALADPSTKEAALAFFEAADLNIVDIRVEPEMASESTNPFLVALRSVLPADVQRAIDEVKAYKIWLKHGVKGTREAWIPFGDESRGTREFFCDLGPIVLALSRGGLLVFDELNSSLHPLLARAIVKLFHSKKWNPRGAQIIFTTHETALLTTDVLRRDQVWFAKKDEQGASIIYSLTDFETRKEASLERQYLHGRFGAIPYISENAFRSLLDVPSEVNDG